jgi:hypothetical protein
MEQVVHEPSDFFPRNDYIANYLASKRAYGIAKRGRKPNDWTAFPNEFCDG